MLIKKLHEICDNKSCQEQKLKKAPIDCHNICTICIAKDLLEDYPDRALQEPKGENNEKATL